MPRRRPVAAVLALALALAVAASVVPTVAATAAETGFSPASAGIAGYADVCSDAPSASDLRHLWFGPTSDGAGYGVIAEGCDAGGAASFEVRFATDGAASPDRRLAVTGSGSAVSWTLTDLPGGALRSAGTGLRRDDRSVQVLLSARDLSPAGTTIRLRALAGTGDGQDQLPDGGRPMVVFPAACQASATVLRVADGDVPVVAAAARRLAARVGVVDEALGIVELERTPTGALDHLARLPGVTSVETVPGFERLAVAPDDPEWSRQWGPVAVGAPVAWATRSGSGKRIAIVDDGIDGGRRDLAGRVAAGRDLVRGTSIAAGANSDLGGHGTAVAGIAAAAGGDGVGMAGIDWTATLLPYRVFDESGCAGHAEVAAAIRAATDAGADVVNLSLGSPSSSSAMEEAVRYAAGRGVVLVAASGNAGDGAPPSYPAAYPEVIAVGATTSSDGIAGYSSTGSHLEVVAPGGTASNGVLSLAERGGYGGMVGTSFAAPMVAGAAALYLAEYPSATPSTLRGTLAATARDLGAAGRDDVYGHGRLDLAALLAADDGSGTAPSDATTDPCDGASITGFTDLTGGPHDAAIECLVHLEVTAGVSPTRYAPARAVTRGQMASFLARYVRGAGADLPDGPDAFRDDDGSTHEAAIDALAAAGIVSGVGGGRYAPERTVTRGQQASFLARTYAHVTGSPLPPGPDAFADDDGTAHEDAIDRVVAAGMASGRADGTFGPDLAVRRDQMATFVVGLARAAA